MAYRLLRDESVEAGIQRIALEQIDKAIEQIDDSSVDRHEAVHQVRKCCKRIRGAIRLVRPQFPGTYRVENAWFRDAAARLSFARDATAMLGAYDKVMESLTGPMDAAEFAAIREILVQRRQRIEEDEAHLQAGLAEFLEAMHKARERVDSWSLQADGFAAVDSGFRQTYRWGRKAMAEAYRNRRPEHFHEWRKQVKDHGYHLRLLQELWPPLMEAWAAELEDLAEWLGEDHDLAVLQQTLVEHPEEFGQQRDLQVLSGLIDQRRAELEHKAHAAGQFIFAEKPRRLSQRLRRYWRAWLAEASSSSPVKDRAAVSV